MTIEKGNITGSGYAGNPIIKGKCYAAKAPIVAVGLGCRAIWKRDAFETSSRNLVKVRRYLIVTPTEPQTLVWMVPGNEIVYSVKSNITWNIE